MFKLRSDKLDRKMNIGNSFGDTHRKLVYHQLSKIQ